jgi:hypothetical protein
MVLEVVSQTRRGEYTDKKIEYAQLGILYYAIYNPLRKRKARLEVYKLVAGEYQLLPGEPVWLSEINLGIGRGEGTYQGINREWLYWYDEKGERYLTPEERILATQNRALIAEEQLKQERERAKRLEQLLREAGIDPNSN